MEKSLPARPDMHTKGEGAHLRDYWKIIRRGRTTLLAIFVLVVGLTLLRVTLATPIYRATAVIEIKPEARRIMPGEQQWVGVQSGSWIAEDKYFNTQLEVIRSRDVAERTFRRLHLERHPLFEKLKDPIGAFAGRVEVKPKIETRLVFVTLSGPDPKEVTEWVNTLADVFVKRNVSQALESFNGIMDEIKRGLDTSRGNIEQANTKRLEIAAEEELFVPENQKEILKKRLETYNEQLSAAHVEIGSLGAELVSLAKIRTDGGDITTLPRCSQDLVVQDLNGQKLEVERDLERLAAEKKPRHPEYVAKERDLQKIKQRLIEQIDRVAEKLQTQYQLKVDEGKFLQKGIRSTEEEAYRVEQASSLYGISKNDAEAKRKVYDVVAETMERLTVSAQLVTMNNNLSILDKAIEPRRPSEPRKRLALLFGSVLGLFLGIGAVLFLDYLDNTVRTPDDIEQYLGMGVLAIVPKRKDANSHAVREAFQSLRTSILFSSQNRERKILLISSAGPQEGKSSTAASLARALASAGDRVIVVDCDLRRPTQHNHMGVPREPGLTNYLLDGKGDDLELFVHSTEIPTLKVLTCGPIPPNPPEIIGGAKFHALLQELKRSYDWVVLDSPPVMNLADAVVLASVAELVALVIKHNENDRDLIRRSIKQLRGINANLIGAVLNQVDLDRGHYGDYYYGGYYYEEGERKTRRSRSRSGGSDVGSRPSDRVAL